MPAKICYLGDGRLTGPPATWPASCCTTAWPSTTCPATSRRRRRSMPRPTRLYVVSDYPAARFGEAAMAHVAGRVEQGAGLVMIGGWESFHGRLGEYHQSPLAAVLPVVMQSCDDRRNFAQPCLIEQGGRPRDPRRAALGPAAGRSAGSTPLPPSRRPKPC